MHDIDRTIISQYAASPVITRLVETFDEWIDPAADFNQFFQMVWWLDTAQGYGLDVWGRIVGVGRVVNVASGIYFGFAEAADVANESPFNSGGPFFGGGTTTSNFALTDDGFRVLIIAKALSNITNGSIPAINQILLTLFPNRGNCYVIDNADMTMIYHFDFILSAVEAAIVENSGVLPKPVGVSVTVEQIDTSSGGPITGSPWVGAFSSKFGRGP